MSTEAREEISRGAGTFVSGTPAQLQAARNTGGNSDKDPPFQAISAEYAY